MSSTAAPPPPPPPPAAGGGGGGGGGADRGSQNAQQHANNAQAQAAAAATRAAQLESTVSSEIDSDAAQFNIDNAVSLFQDYTNVPGVKRNVKLQWRVLLRSLAGFEYSYFDSLLALTPIAVQQYGEDAAAAAAATAGADAEGEGAPSSSSSLTPEMDLLLALDAALHMSQFDKFWSLYEAKKDLITPAVPAFETAMKDAIIQFLLKTVVSLKESDLSLFLHSSDSNLNNAIAPYKVTLEGGVAKFPTNRGLNDINVKNGDRITVASISTLIR